ncbi:NAD-dependent epimerase/dehydratase family protein [Flavobacteriales bacterium]|nr:NAD-dependent epimerase/dehydratase family protein [Flavobacteriales bacterium]
MKNLVTGATGLVGMHILIDLLLKGEKVKATFTKNSRLENVKKLFKFYNKESLFSEIEWVEMDIEDVIQVFDTVKGVDHVYHSAAIVSFLKRDQSKMSNINIKGTANIVNACLENKVKKLGHVSSVAAIGRKGNGDYSEENTWLESNDNSFYAISKNKAENEVWRGVQEGLQSVIINPGIIIGPSTWHRSSTALFKKINSGLSFYPTGLNGFVDVRDVSNSIIELMKSSFSSERYILVAENLTYESVIKRISKSLNVNPPTYVATPRLMNMVWRIEYLISLVTGKNPKITKETAKTSSQKNFYNNEKIKKQIGYKFNSIENAIENTAKYILEFKQ